METDSALDVIAAMWGLEGAITSRLHLGVDGYGLVHPMDALLRLEFNNDAHCLCGGSIYFFNFGSLRVHRVIIVNWASSFWREDWSQEKKEEEEMRTWDINWDPLIARSQSHVSKQFDKISLTNSFLKLFFCISFLFSFSKWNISETLHSAQHCMATR